MNKITIFSFYSGKHALTQGISFLFTSFSLACPGSLAFSVLSFSNNVLCPFVLAVALSPLLPLTHLLASHWPRLSSITIPTHPPKNWTSCIIHAMPFYKLSLSFRMPWLVTILVVFFSKINFVFNKVIHIHRFLKIK